MVVLSCSGQFPTVRSECLVERGIAKYGEVCHVISTQFSLPFRDISSAQRVNWLAYRHSYFMASTYRSIEEQTMSGSCASYVWLIFISRGDRRLLNLPSCEMLVNGIRILWIEVDRAIGKDPDYYRSTIMESICIRIAAKELEINKKIGCFVFSRVDSDDFIGRRFLDITTAISCNWMCSAASSSGFYFNYPCGLTYDRDSGIISSKIWPESSFTFYVVRSQTFDKGIWKWPHDKISHHWRNEPIVTTLPMWCITTNHGNIANTGESYFSTQTLRPGRVLGSIH